MKKIIVLLENRFIEREILYYSKRFEEDGIEAVFMTRLWGQPSLTFKGLELSMDFTVNESFEPLLDESGEDKLKDFGAVIAPAGYVSDYLLYSEKPGELSPAAAFIAKIMKNKDIVKAFICHSLWIAGPSADLFKGRTVTCHNNIISHVKNAGMTYADKTLVIDEDLITARTGDCYPQLAKTLIMKLTGKEVCDIV